jgi:hypothetical protein
MIGEGALNSQVGLKDIKGFPAGMKSPAKDGYSLPQKPYALCQLQSKVDS